MRERNRSMAMRRVFSGAALALALLATTPSVAAPAAPVTTVDPARLAGLPEFIDGVMAQQIATREVAGAVVTVVSGGKVVFSKGYGYADVDRKIPVDAEKTLFRPGSVSKLFTWTALMQQVEKGRVKLDDDVNKYLDFKIPATFKKPILVRDLFTHAPGLEDRGGITVESTADFVPLGTFLKNNIPTRVRDSGVESSYSNYGSAIAGYIVQRVTGEAFPDYVDRHIFGPLGMKNTTFREPLTGTNAENMALGYEVKDGRFIAKPFELYGNIMPAGSASATGPDMARFMLAQLGDGSLGDARILKPETMKLMRETLHKNAPSLPGMALWVHRFA